MCEQQMGTPRIRLLLIDDEKEYASVLSKRFSRRNIDTIKADNGAKGLQALRWTHFDVVVLDLKLGSDMDGLEVLKVCKKIDEQLPIIILTGHGSAEAAQEGLALGAFDYLTKPCDLEELLQKIYQAVWSSKPGKCPNNTKS
jgi:DNA-binding NtrC family response regulator